MQSWYAVPMMCLPLLTLVLGGCATAPSDSPSALPAVAPTCKALVPSFHEGTQARHDRFNAISKEGKATLVFLGDSITQSWEGGGKAVWDKYYEKRNAANFGVSGDRTENVLWRLDHGNFDGLSPKLIVVMIGTNNTGHRKDPAAETAAGVGAILDRLKVKCPKSKILLLAIFPRGETKTDELRVINDEANTLIRTLADGKRVVWKDVSDKFLDASGAMKKDLMPDLLHPNTKGYEVWAEAMDPEISKLLGE